MTTIRDIARRAQVSIGTVSNVLNERPGVKAETRQRVLDAIAALDYSPNAAARTLKTQRTNTIGFVRVATLGANRRLEADPFVFELIEGLANAASAKRYGLTYWAASADAQVDLYRSIITERRVDGLIIAGPVRNDPRIALLSKQSFPHVVFGRPEHLDEHLWVDVDSKYGFDLAVNHLVELGHECIGYIAPPNEMLLSHRRWESFVGAMNAAGVHVDEHFVYEGDFSEQSGQLAAHYLLDFAKPPTALICSNDSMAIGAARAAQARQLVVGKDISIIGYDDIALASYSAPPLTTIRQPLLEICEQLFELLMDFINNRSTTTTRGRLLQPQLVLRQSTGPIS